MHKALTLAAAALLVAPLAGSPQGPFDPPVATDINPAANVVEVNLVAAETTWQFTPGVSTRVWTYNGSIPGPTIFANLGDTIIVHLTNNLPQPTTVHWHGVEVPAVMDGSNISQFAVQPGETFDYVFTALEAGTFWYHPHVRTHDQVERGLHGVLVIRDPATDQALASIWSGAPIEEHVVVFDDVLLDASNELVPPFSFTDPLQNAIYQLNGREGNVLLVNGRAAGTVALPVTNGAPQRWRIVNVANTTIARLDFHDPNTGIGSGALWQIGQDGDYLEQPLRRGPLTSTAPGSGASIGLLAEMDQGALVFAGQRMDLMFTPRGSAGQQIVVHQTDWFRGRQVAYWQSGRVALSPDPMDGSYPSQPFVTMTLVGAASVGGDYVPPARLTTYPPLPAPTAPDIRADLSHSNPDAQGNVRFFAQTGRPASTVTSFDAQDVEVGDVRTWEVTNRAFGEHPFHCHGFSFELVEFEFIDQSDPTNPQKNFVWRPNRRFRRDSIRIPPRLGPRGASRCVARLRIHFDDTGRDIVAQGTQPSRRGDGSEVSGAWLFHCHLLEHSAKGMLSMLEVRDPADPFHLLGFATGGGPITPSLSGRGDPTPGARVDLDLVDAEPNVPLVLLVSAGVFRNQQLGVTIIPGPPLVGIPGASDAQGEATWTFANWPNLTLGADLYWQAGFAHPGGPAGFAISNALKFATR